MPSPPDTQSEARTLSRRERRMHELLADLVAADDMVAAARLRRDLAGLPARRSQAAAGSLTGRRSVPHG